MEKYQEGGLATANQTEPQGVLGIFQSMNMTTPEAQRWAREYLEEFQGYDWATEEDILQQRRDVAEESRQALISAREQVLGTQFDPRQKWLAMAQAFGSPTRTGAFGETIGNVAGALREPYAQAQEFEKSKREQLIDLQSALSGIDEDLLESEFGLQSLRRGQELGMAKEAARILGRQTPARPPSVTQLPGIKSLDQKMATEYTDWVAGGQADAQMQQVALRGAIQAMEESDSISGPWVGAFPKWARDMFIPESADIQETVETVAQRSLKAILGGQFGEREGMMLLQRTFNPRLEESKNRERAYRLMQQIKQAADEKQRAMQWFEDYGTMAGYDGKTSWTLEDFMPPEVNHTVIMPNGDEISVPDHWNKEQVLQFYETGERPQFKKGGKVRKKRRKKGRRSRRYRDSDYDEGYLWGAAGRSKAEKANQPSGYVWKDHKYQEGGRVDEDEEKVLLDELEDTGVPLEEVGETGITPGDVGVPIAGAVVGTGLGLGAEELATRAAESRMGTTRPPRSEQLVGEAMEISGVPPGEAVAEVKRARRSRTPSRLLDESGRVTQRLGERAMVRASAPGDVALDLLEERFAQSPERVGALVERGLRTPEFHSTEARLTDRLYERARPLYEQAYTEGEKMPWPQYWQEWMDRPYSRQAIDIATEFMAAEGKMIGTPDATGVAYNTSLEFLDQLKRGFDQLIRTEESGTGPTPRSRIMKKQRAQLIRFLDTNAPEAYQKARQQYKGDLEVLEALDIGRREYHRLDPEEARLMLDDMTWSEKGALRTGVAQRIYDVIYNPSSDVDAAKRILGSQNMRRRLQLLFERPADWRIFEAALEREMQMFQSDRSMKRRVESGRTGRQVGEVLEMDNPLRAAKEAMSRGPLMWALRIINPAGGRRAGGMTEQQADEIVDILLTRDIAELERIAPQLEYATEYARTRRGRRGKAALVGAGIGAAVTAASRAGAGELEDEEPSEEIDIDTLREVLGIEEE